MSCLRVCWFLAAYFVCFCFGVAKPAKKRLPAYPTQAAVFCLWCAACRSVRSIRCFCVLSQWLRVLVCNVAVWKEGAGASCAGVCRTKIWYEAVRREWCCCCFINSVQLVVQNQIQKSLFARVCLVHDSIGTIIRTSVNFCPGNSFSFHSVICIRLFSFVCDGTSSPFPSCPQVEPPFVSSLAAPVVCSFVRLHTSAIPRTPTPAAWWVRNILSTSATTYQQAHSPHPLRCTIGSVEEESIVVVGITETNGTNVAESMVKR